MIENDAQLDQALEVMGMMYRGLAGLRKEVLPKSRQWFNLMAEGPVDEIRRLQKEIDAYTGMDQVAFDDEGPRKPTPPRPMPERARSAPDRFRTVTREKFTMDQAIRNKLRSVVTQCRRLLEGSIAQQLQGKYDIYATGKKDEVRAKDDAPLGHLTDEERQARQDILAHFKHIDSLVHKPKDSLEQLIREIAFTHLNRLCAYKMMEVRDVYAGGQRFREAVRKGLKSQGILFYLADHPEDEKRYNAGDQETAYRHFLNWLGGMLSQEIGVLFSPTDPANRVYRPQRVLDEVLVLINSEELKGIWSEDETIGWVYQYFTPKELRDQARKESQAPRNSYELAFRNQFFTRRYVVEFLTDNTLGRIWYEMRKGKTRLNDECRYMVRRPTEIFLQPQIATDAHGSETSESDTRVHPSSSVADSANLSGTTSANPDPAASGRITSSGTPRAAARPRSSGCSSRRGRTTPSGSTTTGSTRTSSSKRCSTTSSPRSN